MSPRHSNRNRDHAEDNYTIIYIGPGNSTTQSRYPEVVVRLRTTVYMEALVDARVDEGKKRTAQGIIISRWRAEMRSRGFTPPKAMHISSLKITVVESDH